MMKMKRVWLSNSVMVSLMIMLGMGACKSIGQDESQQSGADLSGIYDENYLLRLAEVETSADEKSGTYRFELCDASGQGCVSAFEDAEGQEVLVELSMVNELDLGRGEYKELAQQIDEYHDTKMADYDEKIVVNLRIRSVGTLMQWGSLPFLVSLPVVFVVQGWGRGASGIVKAGTSFMAGLTMAMSGSLIRSEAMDRQYKAEQNYIDAAAHKIEAQDAYAAYVALPKYLHITHGILSTDPDKHVSVVGDSSVDVKDVAFALAVHFNATFGQYISPPGNVVDSVCFMKGEVKVCEVLSPAR